MMKRIFYIAIMMMVVFAACKKSATTAPESAVVTDPLVGSWEQILFVPNQYNPASFTFKKDLSYSRFLMGDLVGEKGVYKIASAYDQYHFSLLLTKNGVTIPDTLSVEIYSGTEMRIRERGLESSFHRK